MNIAGRRELTREVLFQMAHDDSSSNTAKAATLASLLRQMFDTISAKAPPSELIDLVDQLDGRTDPPAEDADVPPPTEARLVLATA